MQQVRRDFVSHCGLAVVGGMVLTDHCLGQEKSPPSGKQSFLVIGAGLAGLAAARHLQQQGHQVIVIEARDRIGGRIWTSRKWKDMPLDLGASWIHGVDGNPIATLADEIEGERVATSYEKAMVYSTSGQPLTDDQEIILADLHRKLWKAIRSAQELDTDQSVRQSIASLQRNLDRTSEAYRMIDFLLSSSFEQEYAGSAGELSVHWFDSSEEFEGDDELFLEGFGVIIESLAENLSIETGQIVQRIEWGSKAIRVVTQKSEFLADRVLVTLPLGVLKSGKVEFSPELPRQKQRAIDTLGFGVLNKCYLRFEHCFWPDNVDWLEFVSANHGEWTEWVSFQRTAEMPILLGFNAADRGKEIEALSDSQIVASGMDTLRKMFGKEIPDPEDYQITRWAADPFSLGSYSFNALGSTPKMRDELAAPLHDRLYFAGEATQRAHFATAHGAYMSGLRAAREMLRG